MTKALQCSCRSAEGKSESDRHRYTRKMLGNTTGMFVEQMVSFGAPNHSLCYKIFIAQK